jgi:hypothetical protein
MGGHFTSILLYNSGQFAIHTNDRTGCSHTGSTGSFQDPLFSTDQILTIFMRVFVVPRRYLLQAQPPRNWLATCGAFFSASWHIPPSISPHLTSSFPSLCVHASKWMISATWRGVCVCVCVRACASGLMNLNCEDSVDHIANTQGLRRRG